MRQEWQRLNCLTRWLNTTLNTHNETLSGEEIIAAVLVSHAGHLPTHTTIVGTNRSPPPAPKFPGHGALPFDPKVKSDSSSNAAPRDSTGEICRLYSLGKCKFGATCKRVRDGDIALFNPLVKNKTPAVRILPRRCVIRWRGRGMATGSTSRLKPYSERKRRRLASGITNWVQPDDRGDYSL